MQPTSYTHEGHLSPALSEPQQSPPPPRPSRAGVLNVSSWSPATYTPPSAARGANSLTPPSAPADALHRQSTAKTYRQLDWSVEETSLSPRSPSRAFKNVSFLPEDSSTTEAVNRDSGISVLSRSADVSPASSTGLHARLQNIRGPLSGQSSDRERTRRQNATLESLGDRLVALAVLHAGAVARSSGAPSSPRAAACRIVAGRTTWETLPHFAEPQGYTLTDGGVPLTLSMQPLPCRFDVARQVLSQPNARTHWDTHLRGTTVLAALDNRRTALVREVHDDYPRGRVSTQLCVAREALCNVSHGEHAPHRREALAALIAASSSSSDSPRIPSRVCAWASTPLPSDAFGETTTGGLLPVDRRTTDQSPLSAMILIDVAPPASHTTPPAFSDEPSLWVFLLDSAVSPRKTSEWTRRDQCRRLAALCALEQDAVDASSMQMELTPLRFPKPTETEYGSPSTPKSVAALFGDHGGYVTQLDASVRACLTNLATHCALPTAPRTPPQVTRPTHRLTREAFRESLAMPESLPLGHSPEPRQPTGSSSARSPTVLSSSLSSSFASAPASTGPVERPPPPSRPQWQVQTVTPIAASPALSHKLDAVSSIQLAGEADLSLHGPLFPVTPTALEAPLAAARRPTAVSPTRLTAEALRRHRAARRLSDSTAQQGRRPQAPEPPDERAWAAAQKHALEASPYRRRTARQPPVKKRAAALPTAPVRGLRVTLLCCTGIPQLAGDARDGSYQLGVVLRLSSGPYAQSQWYPYATDVGFCAVNDGATAAAAERTNVLTCPLPEGDPMATSESLTITVVVQTPKKKIRLGVASLHAANLRATTASIVACHVIGKAGTRDAQERCLLQLSVLPLLCGLAPSACVPVVEEVRRRQWIWRALQTRAREQLHRLEWFVGLLRPRSAQPHDVEALLCRLVDGPVAWHPRPSPHGCTRTAPRQRRTVSARAFEPRAHRTDSPVVTRPQRSDRSLPRHAVLRRSLSMPLLRSAPDRTTDVAACGSAATTECATTRKAVPALSDANPKATHHRKKESHRPPYALQFGIQQVSRLCDSQGELLSTCACTFVVVTLHPRPGARRTLGAAASVPENGVASEWRTSRVPYMHHVAHFPDSVLDVPADDLYDSVARLTVMAGNAGCHTVVGHCDISLRYVRGSVGPAEEAVADDVPKGRSNDHSRLFCLYRELPSIPPPTTTTTTTASQPVNQRVYIAVGSIRVDLRCRETSMTHYLSRQVIHDALAVKAQHSATVAALLSRYKPSLLPSLDVQLDQVAAHGLDTFTRRKRELWDCSCSLADLAQLSVRVLDWTLYAIHTASPVVLDPQRLTAVADPQALALHAARLGKDWAGTLPTAARQGTTVEPVSVYVAAHCAGAVFAVSDTVQSCAKGVNLTAHFNHWLASCLVEPGEDVLSLRVLQKIDTGSADYEVGRVDLPLSVFRASGPSPLAAQRLTVPLTASAGTPVAYQCGSLSVEVGLTPLASSPSASWAPPTRPAWRGFEEAWIGRTRLERLCYHRAPWQLHRAFVLLKRAYTDSQAAALCDAVTARVGAPGVEETYTVQVAALRGLDRDTRACYVKVYHATKSIVRTATLPIANGPESGDGGEAQLGAADGGRASFTVTDPLHDTLRLKLGRTRRLGRNEVVARAQVSLAAVSADSPANAPDLWIPLFDVSDTNSKAVGEICLKLTRSGTTGAPSSNGQRGAVVPVGPRFAVGVEQQTRDVVSLLQAYAPVELPRVHSLLMASTLVDAAADPIARTVTPGPRHVFPQSAHAPLRAMLAPLPVAVTVHVSVEGVDLQHADLLPLDVLNGDALRLAVSTWGSPVATCACPLHVPTSSRQRSTPAVVARLDVPSPFALDESAGEQTALDIVLEHTLPVQDDRDTVGGLLRGRLSTVGGRTASARSNSSGWTSVSRSRSGGGPSRDSSLGRESAGTRTADEDARSASLAPVVTAVPVGQCRVSLRALLTPDLYAAGEVLSVPLVCSYRTLAFRFTTRQRQHLEQSRTAMGLDASEDFFVLGRLRLSVRLAGGDRAPTWLRLPRMRTASEQGRRRVAQLEASLIASRDVKALMGVHYTALEDDKAATSDLLEPASVRDTAPARTQNHQARHASPAPRRPRAQSMVTRRADLATATIPARITSARTDDEGSAVATISTPSWTVCSQIPPAQRHGMHVSTGHHHRVEVEETDRSVKQGDPHGLTFLVSPSTLNESRSRR